MRGIHAVLLNLSERIGSRYATAACVHSGRSLRGVTDRSWVAGLNRRGTEPAGWPRSVTRCSGEACRVVEHARWSVFRARWLRTLAMAEALVLETAFCGAATWGSDRDVADGRAAGRTWTDDPACAPSTGATRNHFGAWGST